MDNNTEFISENMALLYQIHGEKFVAIRKQSIMGVYDSLNKAKKAAKNIQDAEIFKIQKVFKDKAD